MQIQVTLFSTTGKYKPVSCLIEVESAKYYFAHKAEIRQQGIVKICQKRLWNTHHLKQYGYTKVKMREYKEANK